MSRRHAFIAAAAAACLALAATSVAAQLGGGRGGAGGGHGAGHGHWAGGGGGGGGAHWVRGGGGGHWGRGGHGGAVVGHPGGTFGVAAGVGHGGRHHAGPPLPAPTWRGTGGHHHHGGARIGIGIGSGWHGYHPHYRQQPLHHGHAHSVWARPRIGVYVPVLPSVYSTWYYGSSPYYYSDGYYYAPAAGGGYTVVDPPPGAVTPAQPPPGPPAPVIYPRLGQSAEQTEFDRRECNRWATEQPDAVADAGVFQRSVEACMDARGYTVR